MFRARTLVGWLLAIGLAAAPAQAQLLQQPPTENDTVIAATTVLNELAAIPLQGIPQSMLAQAQGVVICPDVIKAGFILGGRHGRGVLLTRTPEGRWSNPVFVRISGGSIGWQAGVQSTDVVLVLATPRSVSGVLTGQKFTLGADASIAAGPVGRTASAGTDLTLQSEIYSYSRSRGLFAGVALDGSVLSVDGRANGAYYGRAGITPAEIIAGQNLVVPASAGQLQAALMLHAAPPTAAPQQPQAPFAPQQPSAPQPVVPQQQLLPPAPPAAPSAAPLAPPAAQPSPPPLVPVPLLPSPQS